MLDKDRKLLSGPIRSEVSVPVAGGDIASLVEEIGDRPVLCHRIAREVEPMRAEGSLPLLPDSPETIR